MYLQQTKKSTLSPSDDKRCHESNHKIIPKPSTNIFYKNLTVIIDKPKYRIFVVIVWVNVSENNTYE